MFSMVISVSRSFVRAFKKTYKMVPSTYRQSSLQSSQRSSNNPLFNINYLEFKPDSFLHLLSAYLPRELDLPTPRRDEIGSLTIGEIDCRTSLKQLRHSWRELVCVGRAKELLLADVQEMLRRAQKEIGFRYIRFHGIFSDDMLVCRREKNGTLRFSFTLVDKVLDFVLSLGLRPMIQFSFMPEVLAENPSKKVFQSSFVISPPRRITEWRYLLRTFLEHVRTRYGLKELRAWRFSVWNEPDTSPEMFGFEDVHRFYELYDSSYRTVKEFDDKFIFGSPSLFPTNSSSFTWLKDFLQHVRTCGTQPDFIDVHYYSDNFDNVDVKKSQFIDTCSLRDDPRHFSTFLSTIQNFLRREHLNGLPLYVTEWNLTVSHRNLINDTCFKACYLVRNYLENIDCCDALGYWSLTDFIEEIQPQGELFHGGMGLFTQNGIPKSSYYAMQMLRRLGNKLIANGEGFFVTGSGQGIQIILYNYTHFDPLFISEGFGLSQTDRDAVFPQRRALDLSLTLTGLTDDCTYRIRETILNQEYGSCFDTWVRMGGQELTIEEAEWLQRNSEPAIRLETVRLQDGKLPYNAILAPHEVRLVELIPVNE